VEPYLAIDNAKGWLWVSDPTLKKIYRYNLDGKQRKSTTRPWTGRPLTAMTLPPAWPWVRISTLTITDGGEGHVLTLKP